MASASSSESSDPVAALTVATEFLPFNGPFLIALYMTWLLYGCLLVQICAYNSGPLSPFARPFEDHYYFFHSVRDRWLKALVGAASLAATLHVGLASATQWKILVERWGDGSVWVKSPWEAGFAPLTSALNGVIVQFFYATRITRFSRHILVRGSAVIISLASLLALAGSIAIAVLFVKTGANSIGVENEQTAICVWSISSAVCDVLIAVTMITILARAQTRTSVKKIQNILTRLILQSIETGTVTAVNMLAYLICYETLSSVNTLWAIWGFVSGPLYGNVLLFVLNSRQRHRDELDDGDTLSVVPTSDPKVSDPSRGVGDMANVTTESNILAQHNAHAMTQGLMTMTTNYSETRSRALV